MEMPTVDYCFGMFPPKYASFLISIVGLTTGGLGLTGIILFGVFEEFIIAHFTGSSKLNGDIKMLVLGTMGMVSILLILANALLFFGVTTGSSGLVGGAKLTMLVMCLFLIFLMVTMPLICFFFDVRCLIKQISTPGVVLAYLLVGFFVWFWLYFMVVAYSHEDSM